MIKGCQKRIIYFKSPDGGVFEEAYFILRPDSDEKQLNDRDMVKEAARIIEGAAEGRTAPEPHAVRRGKRRSFLLFFAGVAAASAVFLLFGLCSSLL